MHWPRQPPQPDLGRWDFQTPRIGLVLLGLGPGPWEKMLRASLLCPCEVLELDEPSLSSSVGPMAAEVVLLVSTARKQEQVDCVARELRQQGIPVLGFVVERVANDRAAQEIAAADLARLCCSLTVGFASPDVVSADPTHSRVFVTHETIYHDVIGVPGRWAYGHGAGAVPREAMQQALAHRSLRGLNFRTAGALLVSFEGVDGAWSLKLARACIDASIQPWGNRRRASVFFCVTPLAAAETNARVGILAVGLAS